MQASLPEPGDGHARPDPGGGRDARWSADFVHDQLADGRRLRLSDVIDDVTKERLAAVVDASISGRREARDPAVTVARRGKPDLVASDHGSEVTSNAMLAAPGDRLREMDALRRSPIAPPAPAGHLDRRPPASGG